jgi:methyl-accepting chemotaxis protein
MHDFFDRPAIDAKKAHQQALWTFIEGVVTVADGTVDDLVKFRQDIDQTILHLPHTISDPIYAKINPKLKSFDRFIENEYRPVAEDLSNAIHVLTDTTERQTDTLGGITNSILNPGDLLGNIDNLSDLEKIRQEGKIAEIANRAPVRASESVNESIAESHKGIKEIFDASIKIREKPPYHIPEIKQLVYEISITPPLHLTWFVGDF